MQARTRQGCPARKALDTPEAEAPGPDLDPDWDPDPGLDLDLGSDSGPDQDSDLDRDPDLALGDSDLGRDRVSDPGPVSDPVSGLVSGLDRAQDPAALGSAGFVGHPAMNLCHSQQACRPS